MLIIDKLYVLFYVVNRKEGDGGEGLELKRKKFCLKLMLFGEGVWLSVGS